MQIASLPHPVESQRKREVSSSRTSRNIKEIVVLLTKCAGSTRKAGLCKAFDGCDERG